MTFDSHSLSIIERIPTELLFAIGLLLDGPSVSEALRVCRRWHHTLLPLVWCTISEYQWHDPSFPLKPLVTPSKDLALLPCLLQVRHIGWADNVIVSSSTPAGKPLKTIARQLSSSRLAWVLQNSPGLTSLSLRRHYNGFDPVVFQAVAAMPNLKRLYIHAQSHKTRIPIEDMFPLFSRLEELHFVGSWHNHEMGNEQIFSRNNNMTTPWRLKKLACNRPDIPLTRLCPNLTYLEIVSIEHHTNPQTTSLRFLMACPKLETVKLPTSTSSNSFIDVAETLRSLEALRSLTFNISWRDELEVLCTSDLDSRTTNNEQYQEPESDPFADMNQKLLSVPMLEHLHINCIYNRYGLYAGGSYQATFRMLHNILLTRVNLKSFELRKDPIDPALLFARPGQEAHDSWGCKDLESLVFSLPRPMYYKTAEEEWAYWQPIYRQIGQLSKLKSLEITCPKVQKDKHSGILQLSGATSLQRLVLHGTDAIVWTREETMDLLRVLPRLETLQLKPLTKGCSSKMRAWLREAGRSDIAFNEECREELSDEHIARLKRIPAYELGRRRNANWRRRRQAV